jgi:hypothetical protein
MIKSTKVGSMIPITYPILMESESGFVVLFYEERKGTVVFVPDDFDGYRPMGSYDGMWTMLGFKKFHGKIDLTNG